MAKLTFRVLDSKVVTVFRKLRRTIGDPQKPLKLVGEYLTQVGKQSFANQSSPEGVGWSPLTPSTKEAKAKDGYSPKALIRTGQMRKSISYTVFGRNTVFIGPADRKAPWHQYGTNLGGSSRSGGHRAGVPARPFMGVGPQHEAKVNDIVSKWMRGVRL